MISKSDFNPPFAAGFWYILIVPDLIMVLKHFRADPQLSAISVQAVGTQDVVSQREILQTEFYNESFAKRKGDKKPLLKTRAGQKSSEMHLPASCGWVWWPQQWEKLWSPPPIPHVLTLETAQSARANWFCLQGKGEAQSLCQLGKLGFPQSPPAAEDKGQTSEQVYLGMKLSPKQIPLCRIAWNSAAHLLGLNPSLGFRANTAKFVWLWFSTWHRNLQKCHPEHSQEELDPKPLEIHRNPDLCPCFGADCSFLRMVQELSLAQAGLEAHAEEHWLRRGRWAQGNHSPDVAGKQTVSIEFWFSFENYRAFQGAGEAYWLSPMFFWVEGETRWVMAGWSLFNVVLCAKSTLNHTKADRY